VSTRKPTESRRGTPFVREFKSNYQRMQEIERAFLAIARLNRADAQTVLARLHVIYNKGTNIG